MRCVTYISFLLCDLYFIFIMLYRYYDLYYISFKNIPFIIKLDYFLVMQINYLLKYKLMTLCTPRNQFCE